MCKDDNSEPFRTSCIKITLEIVTVILIIGDKRKWGKESHLG